MTTRNNRWQTHKRTKRGKQTWTTYQRVNQHKTDFTHKTKGLNRENARQGQTWEHNRGKNTKGHKKYTEIVNRLNKKLDLGNIMKQMHIKDTKLEGLRNHDGHTF